MFSKGLDDDVAFEKQLPDYNSKLWKGLYSQWRSRKFCDMKVVTTNGMVPMHACVWSAFSAEMANMVREEPPSTSKHQLSVSLAVSSEVVSYIVRALYTGLFSPPKRLLAQLYTTASYLGFSDLLDLMDQHCRSNSLDPLGGAGPMRNREDNMEEEVEDYVSAQNAVQSQPLPPPKSFKDRVNKPYLKGKKMRTQLNRINTKQASQDPKVRLYQWSNVFSIESFAPKTMPSKKSNVNYNATAPHRETADNGDNSQNKGSEAIILEDCIKEEVDADLEPKVFVCNIPESETLSTLDSWSKTRVKINRINLTSKILAPAPKLASVDNVAGSKTMKAKLSEGFPVCQKSSNPSSIKSRLPCSNLNKCNSSLSLNNTCSEILSTRRSMTNNNVIPCTVDDASMGQSTGERNAPVSVPVSQPLTTKDGCRPSASKNVLRYVAPGDEPQRRRSSLSNKGLNLAAESNLAGPSSDHHSLGNSTTSITSISGMNEVSRKISASNPPTEGTVAQTSQTVDAMNAADAAHAVEGNIESQSNSEDSQEDCYITLCLMSFQKDHAYAQTSNTECVRALCNISTSDSKQNNISNNSDNNINANPNSLEGACETREIKREIDPNSGSDTSSHSIIDVDRSIKQEVNPDNLQPDVSAKGHTRANVDEARAKITSRDKQMCRESNPDAPQVVNVAQTEARNKPIQESSDRTVQNLRAKSSASTENTEKGKKAGKLGKIDKQMAYVNVEEYQRQRNTCVSKKSELTDSSKSFAQTALQLDDSEENNAETTCGENHIDLPTNCLPQENDEDGRLELPGEFAEIAAVLPVEEEIDVDQRSKTKQSSLSVEKTSELSSTPSSHGTKSKPKLTKCFVSIERLAMLENQLGISSQNEIFPRHQTEKDDLETASETTERVLKSNSDNSDLKSSGDLDPTHSKKHCHLKKLKRQNIPGKAQRTSVQTQKSIHLPDKKTSHSSKTKRRKTARDGTPVMGVSRQVDKTETSGNSEGCSRPKRKRMLSTRLAGCKLFGDLGLPQDSQEIVKNPKRPKTRARSPTPSLSPPSSPCTEKDDDGNDASSWAQSSSDSESNQDDQDEYCNPEAYAEDGSSQKPGSSLCVENACEADRDGAVNNPDISEELTEILSHSHSEECNTDLVTLSPLHPKTTSTSGVFKCQECSRVFLNKESLTKHEYTVHDVCPISMKCTYCGHLAKTSVELRQHSIQFHGDSKPFKCLHKGCCFSGIKRHDVVVHMMVHSNLKLFRCQNCGRSFKSEYLCRQHFNSCYNMKKFICEVCGRRFNQEPSMRQHVATMHEGAKPYLCTFCGKTFSSGGNLKRHLRIHKNSFPYPCKFCKAKFRHSNTLKGHVETKHKIRNFKPQRVL